MHPTLVTVYLVDSVDLSALHARWALSKGVRCHGAGLHILPHRAAAGAHSQELPGWRHCGGSEQLGGVTQGRVQHLVGSGVCGIRGQAADLHNET